MVQATDTASLVVLEEATRMLAECRTVDEAKKIRNLAEAARVYARESKLGEEAQNYAAEIRLRAERRGGEILAEMLRTGERVTAANGRPEKASPAVRLSDLGIEPNESARWQKLAEVPQQDFEQYIETAKETRTPITTAGALRGQSSEERAAIAADTRRLFSIYEAIEKLAQCEDAPSDWTALEHHASRYRVTDNIDAALTWLKELKRVWTP